MLDIALYGHLTVDRVFNVDSEYQTLGSIANVWQDLINLDWSLKIGLSPMYFGEALIFADKPRAERIAKVSLNIQKKTPKILDSKIHHLMYLNCFEHFDFIGQLKGIITADLCLGKSLNPQVIKYVDYLFVSDEDEYDINVLQKYIKGYIILHSRNGSMIYNSTSKVAEYAIPVDKLLKDVNVLGAGDSFAASFLYNLIRTNNIDIKNRIEFAHNKTTEILKIKNET